MINTVQGKIDSKNLGVTLMHEHITWSYLGADKNCEYDSEEVISKMLPFLLEIKELGCNTLVDATTHGTGRDLEILKECSIRTGLNILTNIGAWDGGRKSGRYIPDVIKHKDIDGIVEYWVNEYENGIEGTDIRPAYIKIALGDTGIITDLQERILRAAIRVSKATDLPIQCHTIPKKSILKAVKIVEDEGLDLQKFIWIHGDVERNNDVIINLLEKGIWVELDYIASSQVFTWYVDILKDIRNRGLMHKVLISQDAGAYYICGSENEIIPYSKIFKRFIPFCKKFGLDDNVFNILLIENPKRVLDI